MKLNWDGPHMPLLASMLVVPAGGDGADAVVAGYTCEGADPSEEPHTYEGSHTRVGFLTGVGSFTGVTCKAEEGPGVECVGGTIGGGDRACAAAAPAATASAPSPPAGTTNMDAKRGIWGPSQFNFILENSLVVKSK
nr:hypothetical protein [Tanacetum cinerariifolium]